LNLRLVEYFVAVAELEHVGRAAERLHVSQSPLSRQIRHLETELGLELFVREKQRIRLSETGRWLLSQAQGLLAHAERVREEARHRSRGQIGTLYVAFTSSAMWSGALPRNLRRFQARFPGATLELQNMRSFQQIAAVRSGSIDVGFISAPARDRNLEIACVAEESLLLVTPKSHPLAAKRRILPRDLDGARWILLSEFHSAAKHDLFFAACANAGFLPEVVQRVTEPVSLLALVESGLGVGLIRSSARNYAPRSLAFRALPWLSLKARTYMVRQATGRQPLAEAFAGYVFRSLKPALAAQFPYLSN
jgi:DNA-binding transcriptional LysR family regulator